MTADTFDWGSIPYETWMEFARTVGADERHAKFAAAKFRKCTNTQAAREAGFGVGSGTSTRSEGYRVARSNKVNQLLALAAAEAGGGYDGTLTKQESRSILTAMARGSDPQVRIKSIELLNKLEREEAAANAKPEDSLEQTFADIIRAVPEDAAGAVIAMSCFNSAFGNVANFPFLKECAPIVSRTYPAEWKKWRDATGAKWGFEFIDRVAAGPLLEGDDLVRAVKSRVPRTETVRPEDAAT
jgi:hypothetical protein